MKVDYDDVIWENKLGESASPLPMVNHVSRNIYGASAKITYNFFAVFLSCFFAIFWGVMAAAASFSVTWILTPPFRIWLTFMVPLAGTLRIFCLSFLEPWFTAVSFALRHIKANITLRSWPSLLDRPRRKQDKRAITA
eukprot:m.311192 g.311192  ORF g.311192 m.311192 type:complete len:138 (+) comp61776_c0_seq1:306-719(+)